MATWYWFGGAAGSAGGGDGDITWSGLNWNAQTDGLGTWGTPGAGDNARFGDDLDGTDCTMDLDKTIAQLDMNGIAGIVPWTGTFTIANTKTLIVTGSCELEGTIVHTGSLNCNGAADTDFQTFATHTGVGAINLAGGLLLSSGHSFAGYTGTITWDGAAADSVIDGANPSLPDFVVNGAGTLTMTADTAFKSLIINAGTFVDGGYSLNFGAGGLFYGGGTVTSTGTWTCTASAEVDFSALIYTLAIAANQTVTFIGATTIGKLTGDATTTIAGASNLTLEAVVNNFWDFQGTCSLTGILVIWPNVNRSNAAKITTAGPVQLLGARAGTLTLSGGLDCGSEALLIAADTAGAGFFAVDITGLNCGAITLATAADREAKLTLHGICTFASLTAGDPGNDENVFAFERANVTVTGTFDGDNIAFTNTAGVMSGGTVQNVDLTGEVPLIHFGSPDGTNTNVINPSRHQQNARAGRAA